MSKYMVHLFHNNGFCEEWLNSLPFIEEETEKERLERCRNIYPECDFIRIKKEKEENNDRQVYNKRNIKRNR